MGRGHHGGILYGCLYSGKKADRALFGTDGDSGLVGDFRLKCKGAAEPDTSYETEAQWIGFWVAELDECLIGRGKDTAACLAYQAIPLTESAIQVRFAKEIASAKAKWDAFAAFTKERGLELAGSLHLVFDYD